MPQTLTSIRQLTKKFLLTFLLASLLSIFMTVTAGAADLPGIKSQTTTSANEGTVTTNPLDSPEAVQSMVSRLSDKEVREILLQRLETDAKAKQAGTTADGSGGVTAFITSWARGVYKSTAIALSVTPDMYTIQKRVINTFIFNQGEAGILRALVVLALALILGLIAEKGITLFTRQWRERIAHPIDPDSYRESLRLLGLRFVLDMIGLVTFIIVTVIVIQTMQSETSDDFSFLVLNHLIFLPRLMLAILRFLLAPTRPELRIVHCNDETAHFLNRHLFGFALLMGLSSAWLTFNRMNGSEAGELRLGYWLSLARHFYVIYIAWHARTGLTEMLSGWDQTDKATTGTIAKLYPGFLMFMSVFLWLTVEKIVSLHAFELLKYHPHTTTLLLMLFIPVFDTIIRTAVTYMFPPMSGSGEVATNAYLSAKSSYIRIGRVLLFGIALFIIAFVWQIRPHDLAARGVGNNIASDMIRFMIILSVGYLVWEVVTLWINRKLAAEQTAAGMDIRSEEPGGEGGGAGSSRLSTILPLMRFTLQTTIVIMTILIAFSNIGINITPLLAGAGVVGIAVGFGAQKLVQDIFSGIFFLIDDAFRAGEYISIEGTLGTVEQISLRSMQLRHHRGAVHTIPYSEIPKLTNFSRDWVIMKLRFTVPFDTDLNKVKKIFKQIGKEMMDVPEFKEDFLQPFKSQGVLEVNDVGIVIRGKFMAKPGTQFMIRKELYNRVQKNFDENGIQFARKEVRVKLDADDKTNLSEEQKTQIAGAAADNAQEEVQAQERPKN
ncbi:MAG: Unknown protein [uncultured Thiotrichaceae bacterium]|uniref:Potassium efflux system KefA protein / Small-conductance mechanosensitive channel n=1 Tax=uncultured Thiotrichaceae bacterium TaxID=298394 RepID=A0A6S6T277_9GAMM|nr:MAG: Unknown protein [uncultured Thiotrichaceae bacterium]